MLLELSITDFAIIERSTIRFSEGLNALTGGTGAGKSILLDALGAVLGSRVSSALVRTGRDAARVEAAFELDSSTLQRVRSQLEEIGVDIVEEDALVLTREIQSNGRSSARINGRLTTAGALASIGAALVDIHGQSDHLAILKPTEQRSLLDRFGSLDPQRSALAADVKEWRGIRQRIAELSRNSREREQRIDLVRFQIDEIEAAAITAGDDEALMNERDVLRNADRLRADSLEALSALADEDSSGGAGVTSSLRRVTALTADITTYDTSAGNLCERATELLVLAEDFARELRTYVEQIESDDARLAEVEDRLASIQLLKRKYGATVQDVLDFAEDARQELSQLTSGNVDIGTLQEREILLSRRVASAATTLSDDRVEAAKRLSAAIKGSIADLQMGGAEIAIAVNRRDDARGVALAGNSKEMRLDVDESGIDDIEFLIAPNTGEALKPLGRIASGGETARLMLATKSILSAVDLTPTLVFDEIDVGVGGRSGQVVGEKLWGISRRHQVIVVTHLPQVAALAENHLKIEKSDSEGRTVSNVRTLAGADRELELAAMIDGLPPGEAARLNARMMLHRSRTFITSSQ
jgi:DNA repair protein RecN (Recombination protein N)